MSFKSVQKQIAKKSGVSKESAGIIYFDVVSPNCIVENGRKSYVYTSQRELIEVDGTLAQVGFKENNSGW